MEKITMSDIIKYIPDAPWKVRKQGLHAWVNGIHLCVDNVKSKGLYRIQVAYGDENKEIWTAVAGGCPTIPWVNPVAGGSAVKSLNSSTKDVAIALARCQHVIGYIRSTGLMHQRKIR